MNRILIIDDDKELCALIKQSVLQESIEADYCYSGKSGLIQLKEKEYQLVILDVMMPGFDGFETLRQIRKENSLPILMFTSKNESASKVRGLREGADDYLTYDKKGKTILISSHILSEIELLADDIGIIDKGVLLEEENLPKLKQKNSKYIYFTISDTAQAARILEQTFNEKNFLIQDDHNIRIYNLDLSVSKIVNTFVENGLEVSKVHTCEYGLEEYFKRITGGEGIA